MAPKDDGRIERSKFYRGSVWRRLRTAALDRDADACMRCGAKPGRARLQVDHVVERKAGGADKLANLETLCLECHAVKTFAAHRPGDG